MNAGDISGDDDLLLAVLRAITGRLDRSTRVENPVNLAENLNRLNPEETDLLRDRLAIFMDVAERATSTQSKAAAAEIWSEIFLHFFEIPAEADEGILLEKKFHAPTVAFVPNVVVTAVNSDRSRRWQGRTRLDRSLATARLNSPFLTRLNSLPARWCRGQSETWAAPPNARMTWGMCRGQGFRPPKTRPTRERTSSMLR
ncbi:hypothetical protein V8F63_15785 [Brevundimonas sp. LF-1]|uniref:hypothetical protein n=1 Tax=Brevundimonas sp. LF-1 TaxID=3126100 RepID=UPI0030DE4862